MIAHCRRNEIRDLAGHGAARPGAAERGAARQSKARQGFRNTNDGRSTWFDSEVLHSFVARHGSAAPRVARRGRIGQGKAISYEIEDR